MKKLLKGLKGKKKERSSGPRSWPSSEPKPVVKVWRGCARTNATLVTLAKRSGTPIGEFEDRIHAAIGRTPFEPVTLIDDAERPLIFYVKENGARFRGVRIAKRTLRDYPAYDVARHVGYAAQIFGDDRRGDEGGPERRRDLPGRRSRATWSATRGIERSYDRWLRGRDGTLNVTRRRPGQPAGPRHAGAGAGAGPRRAADDRPRPAARGREGAAQGHRRGARAGRSATTARCRTPPAAR